MFDKHYSKKKYNNEILILLCKHPLVVQILISLKHALQTTLNVCVVKVFRIQQRPYCFRTVSYH